MQDIEKMTDAQFADSLIKLRKKHKVPQSAIGQWLTISTRKVGYVENGQSRFTLEEKKMVLERFALIEKEGIPYKDLYPDIGNYILTHDDLSFLQRIYSDMEIPLSISTIVTLLKSRRK